MRQKIAEARKALVPVVGLIAQAVSLGFLHGTALDVASAVLWVAAAVGVYSVENAKAPAPASVPAAGK